MLTATLPRRRLPLRREIAGAGLLEALIAIVIFSVSLLGLLGLQSKALANSRGAQYRAEAEVLANEAIGIMWSDRANLTQYAHNGTDGTSTCAPAGTASTNANAVAWLNQFTTSGQPRYLPGATSTAQQVKIGADRTVRVTLCWRAPEDAGWRTYTLVARIPS